MTPREIETLCVARLGEAFNPATALFDRQLRRGTWGPTQGTEDVTSTAIALIGLSRAGVSADRVGLDWRTTREALFARARQRGYAGGLGLLLWANRATGGPPAAEVLGRLGWSLGDVRKWTAPFGTMEVAWLLSGLAHELAIVPTTDPGGAMRAAFDATVDALLARFVESTRTFRHATDEAAPLRRLRRWVANFADQIYAIQGLALASLVQRRRELLEVATRSAEHMASLQGGRGQWWWHYNPRDGRVVQAYPVYSVHQLGMAPMALHTLARAGGPSFDHAIDAGRRWITENELDTPLIDVETGTIWRDIERCEGPVSRQARRVGSLLGRPDPCRVDPSLLEINRETRPYEWAWYLFANALDAEGGGDPLRDTRRKISH